jgi:hypothetical protein
MGHYTSEMTSDDPEFDKLSDEIAHLKEKLEMSPLSAFTVGDLPKIRKLLEGRWLRFHVNDGNFQAMKKEIDEFHFYLAKVPK